MLQIYQTGAEKYSSNKIQSNAHYMRGFCATRVSWMLQIHKTVADKIIVTRSSQMHTTWEDLDY